LCILPPSLATSTCAQSVKKSSDEIMVERMEAIHEIENLMSQYYWSHASDQMKDYLMAYHTPGARVTNDLHEASMMQTEKNTSSAQGLQRDAQKISMRNSPGFLHVHMEASPVIELAADGKSAKGTWISPGLEADPPAEQMMLAMQGKPVTGKRETTGYWAWAKLGAEFVKENGQWRIWHLHVYSLFMTPFDQSWAEADTESEGGMGSSKGAKTAGSGAGPGAGGPAGAAGGAPGGGSNGGPSSGGPPHEETPVDKSTLPIAERWIYSPTAIYPDAKPLPPVPYDTYTFDRNTSY
jgi:hypothetical protein